MVRPTGAASFRQHNPRCWRLGSWEGAFLALFFADIANARGLVIGLVYGRAPNQNCSENLVQCLSRLLQAARMTH